MKRFKLYKIYLLLLGCLFFAGCNPYSGPEKFKSQKSGNTVIERKKVKVKDSRKGKHYSKKETTQKKAKYK